MNLDSGSITKPKYRPNDSQNPDLLINFQLTQENTFFNHQKHLQSYQINCQLQPLNLANDDDLVYSDNEAETSYDKHLIQQTPHHSVLKKKKQVLSDCINLKNLKPQRMIDQKAENLTKYAESDLKLKFQGRMKTQDEGEQSANKSSCFLSNRSVFFTNQTSRSIASSIRFKIKPKTSIKQIVQNFHKTERSRKGS